MWSVYILECRDKTFYTGISDNVPDRIKRHNEGKGAQYTASRRPVTLRYIEKFYSKSKASLREIEIKKLGVKKKKHLIKYGCGKRFPSSQNN